MPESSTQRRRCPRCQPTWGCTSSPAPPGEWRGSLWSGPSTWCRSWRRWDPQCTCGDGDETGTSMERGRDGRCREIAGQGCKTWGEMRVRKSEHVFGRSPPPLVLRAQDFPCWSSSSHHDQQRIAPHRDAHFPTPTHPYSQLRHRVSTRPTILITHRGVPPPPTHPRVLTQS